MFTYADDDAHPFRTVAYIRARFGDDWFIGSGVLVGRNDVLTASHVIYDEALGLADEVRVYFSYDAAGHYSSDRYYGAVYVNYGTGFDPDGDGRLPAGDGTRTGRAGAERDIAILTMDEPVGDIYGWMGMSFGFTSGTVNVTGHPGRYDSYMTNETGWTRRHAVDDYLPIDGFNVNPGNSGGPVWYESAAGSSQVVGLVSTKSAAVSIGGYRDWILDIVRSNDTYLDASPDNGIPGDDDPADGGQDDGGQDDDNFGGTDPIDFIFTGSGIDDHWIAYLESSRYDGGAGTDSVKYLGDRNEYGVSQTVDGTIIVVKPGGVQDRLVSIERLEFEDSYYNLEIAEKAQSIAPHVLNKLIDLYIAYFNRVPEADGLGYWIDKYKGGMSLEAINAQFYDDAIILGSFTGYSADMSLREFILKAYDNVLDRRGDSVPEADVQWWIREIMEGRETTEGMISRFLSDSRLFENDPQWYWMTDYLDHKVELGRLHAVTYGLDYANQAEAHHRTVAITDLVTPQGIDAAVAAIGLGPENYFT